MGLEVEKMHPLSITINPIFCCPPYLLLHSELLSTLSLETAKAIQPLAGTVIYKCISIRYVQSVN